MAALTFDAFFFGEYGDLKKKMGTYKQIFGSHGDQSPQMGTNVGAVHSQKLKGPQSLEKGTQLFKN